VTVEASIVLDPWNVPRSQEQASKLMDYLMRVLIRKIKALPEQDWRRPSLRRERHVSGAVRYILETSARPRFVWADDPLMNN
jgi:hypothetical protein